MSANVVIPRPNQQSPSVVRRMLDRWPAALGLALALLQLATDDPDSPTGGLMVLMVATTAYVVIAALVRPSWSWAVVGVLSAVVLATGLTSAGPAVELGSLVAISGAAIVTGFVRRTWTRADLYRWQPYAAVAFLALSLGALWFAPETGRVLIAVGLIGHALWDLAHWRRHQVVSRSLAEWCLALDFTLGAGVLVLTLWPNVF
ncbi:hypothetical protein [Plantactinospora sp. GCM10030261]|uniref:hypothetical protein n=1 Tax=Plantactinospora sp. GCM10030261 TaxID=3273420 RepID=UPI00360F181A